MTTEFQSRGRDSFGFDLRRARMIVAPDCVSIPRAGFVWV